VTNKEKSLIAAEVLGEKASALAAKLVGRPVTGLDVDDTNRVTFFDPEVGDSVYLDGFGKELLRLRELILIHRELLLEA
jgi:hypothetical protein